MRTPGITVLILVVFLLVSIPSILPNSFAQSAFDSQKMRLGMPEITMTPTNGPPGTPVKISIQNMPKIPEGLDPRIEFFVYLPFLSSSGNVPQTCGGEKCISLYSFNEIQSGKLDSKTITFTLFSKENPKPIIENDLVKSICDLKINGIVIERFGHTCFEKNQPAGKYQIKFGWGILRTNVFDVRETLEFTVLNPTPVEKIDPKTISDQLIKDFQNGLITIAQFDHGLKQTNYDEDNIRKTKSIYGLLPHQFDSLSPKERADVMRACNGLYNGNLIYLATNKEQYQKGDTMYIHGCVHRTSLTQTALVSVVHSVDTVIETRVTPEVDGSFYIPVSIGKNFAEDGDYVTKVIYGEYQKFTPFVVASKSTPEETTSAVPAWIKSNAKWWADNQIDDNTFVQGIQYLIKEKIIQISNVTINQEKSSTSIPGWVKNNAKWWSSNQIDDKTFLQGIEYLVENQIISIPR